MRKTKKWPKKVLVNVAPAHLAYGEEGIPTSCPIALAFKSATGSGQAYVTVNGVEAGSHDDDLKGAAHYVIPLAAQEWLRTYDKGKRVKPFSFVAKLYFLSGKRVR